MTRCLQAKAFFLAPEFVARKNPHLRSNFPRASLDVDSCGSSSGVEHQLPKLRVAGSNPVSRSKTL